MNREVEQGLSLQTMLIHKEIENFLYDEANALDGREFDRWLDFFAEDIRYWIPIRKNLASKFSHLDMGGERDVAWIDDDMDMLRKRVAQILTGVHWAEEPLSRVVHLVTNVRIQESSETTYSVRSNILVHRSRMETETDVIVARREDKIRRDAGSLKIYYRKLVLNHHTLPSKNLSFFL